MAQLLADLARTSNQQIARHMPNPDLRNYFLQIKRPLDRRSRIILRTQRAYKLLVYGNNKEAAKQFQIAKTLALRSRLLDPRFLRAVRECLAIAYLRAAETANHLEQKLISIAPKVGLRSRFIRKTPRLAAVQEDDTSQAGLPLQIRKPVGNWFRAVWAKVNDDKFIYHH